MRIMAISLMLIAGLFSSGCVTRSYGMDHGSPAFKRHVSATVYVAPLRRYKTVGHASELNQRPHRTAAQNMYRPATVVASAGRRQVNVVEHHHYYHGQPEYHGYSKRRYANNIEEGAGTISRVAVSALTVMTAIELGRLFFGGH